MIDFRRLTLVEAQGLDVNDLEITKILRDTRRILGTGDRDGRPLIQNEFVLAAVRVFIHQGRPKEDGYLCSICDDQRNCTGGGGWFTLSDCTKHVFESHPEAVRMLIRMARLVRRTYKQPV